MHDSESPRSAEAFVDLLRRESSRAGLAEIEICYRPTRNVIRVSWPRRGSSQGREAFDVPATRTWVATVAAAIRRLRSERRRDK